MYRQVEARNLHELFSEFISPVVETPAVETKHSNQPEIETVLLLREVLDDAWATLQPEERAETSRIFLAEGIRKAMANGERNPKQLREAALLAAAA